MFTHKRILVGFGTVFVCIAVLAACDALRNANLGGTLPGVIAPDDSTEPGAAHSGSAAQPVPLSKGRKNAALFIAGGDALEFRLLQQDLADVTEVRCDPLGLNPPTGIGPNTQWTEVIPPIVFDPDLPHDEAGSGHPLPVPPHRAGAEYDYVYESPSGETGYALSIRVPDAGAAYIPNFTQIEFSLRAVNPVAFLHEPDFTTPQDDYDPNMAMYPSNDDVVASRSLVDLNGGDVAIFVRGIDFTTAPTTTISTMNFLGPNGWVLFMRDNAWNSGRFFMLQGALKGAPPAYFDTNYLSPYLGDDGYFESVQVNGDGFDANHQDRFTMDLGDLQVCNGGTVDDYAFIDYSNYDEAGPIGASFVPTAEPGAGGFLLVIRNTAFQTGLNGQVVVNPNVAPVGQANLGPPAAVTAGDVMPPPPSGYDETVVPDIEPPPLDPYTENDNSGGVTPGVHEIGWSVFFIHGS